MIGTYGEVTPFTGEYTYFEDGNVKSAAFNQVAAPSPDHYKFDLTYDPIHQLKSGNYSSGVWDPECETEDFMGGGGKNQGAMRQKPSGGGGQQLLAIGCWEYSATSAYDISGITHDDNSNLLTLNRNTSGDTEIAPPSLGQFPTSTAIYKCFVNVSS